MPAGTCAKMRSAYARACTAVVTGGFKFGMTIARANWRAACGTVRRSASPSRKWMCQSSGAISSIEFINVLKKTMRVQKFGLELNAILRELLLQRGENVFLHRNWGS